MGALALAILWINTLLIAAVALRQANEKLRMRRALAPLRRGQEGTGLVEARVITGRGEGESLARYEVEQVGRAGEEDAGRRTIHFSDRHFRAEIAGGSAAIDDVIVTIPEGGGEVWPAREDVLRAAAPRGAEGFEAAYAEARKAKGHARNVSVPIREGARIWLGGRFRRTGGAMELGAAEDVGRLVSAIDPRAWLWRVAALAILFAIVSVIACAGVTALVMTAPIFDGWTSKIGGVIGLGFFLGVQPLGAKVRDVLRSPGSAFVRGVWTDIYSAGRSAQQRVPVE